ncbi:MAG TPA: SDR family oxidoreductase [Urbifossiella sp.]|jgi:NAD(P)-dependent dehydrogenase (short-subunit alcohol dehydrogenase family)|nr:SDR family oxidoreductase [Urbifossiella sp.]
MNRFASLAAAGAGAYLAYRWLRPGYDYRGTHAVVTGGCRGLGLVLARELAARGARLSLCARDPAEVVAAADEFATRGAEALAVECDVTDRQRVREFLAVARRRHGPVDVLVNNAGIISVGPLEEQRLEDFERSLRTHLWAALYAAFEVIPEMKARRTGRIVNIASIGGKIAVPHLLPYVTGKFALVGLSDGLRVELARFGISVTTVCPGLMRTGSLRQAEFKGRHEEEYRWFALGDALPGLSMSAEAAARQILRGVALGDAEIVLTLPAKLAVLARAVAPGLVSALAAAADRFVLPEPGGVGSRSVKGADSRGRTPDALTARIDRAAERNNETRSGVAGPPPLPSPVS